MAGHLTLQSDILPPRHASAGLWGARGRVAAFVVRETSDVVVVMVWRAVFRPPRRMKDARLVVVEEKVA